MGVLKYCILYIVWGCLDLINLSKIYEHFFRWRRENDSKKNLVAVGYYFLVTILFACATGIDSKIGCFILYIPFYLKAVPVIRCFFEKQKMQLCIVTVLLYQELISFIEQMYICLSGGNAQHVSWTRSSIYVVICLLFLIVITVMVKISRDSAISIYFQEIPLRVYYILCAVVFCIGVVADGLFVGENITGADLSFTRIFAVMSMFFLCWLIFEILKINQQKVSTGKIADFTREQMKGMTEYYNELSIKETELRRFRHDVKNMLIVLHSMIEQKHDGKALEYIENMETIYKTTTKGVDTGNIIADALLNTKMHVAAESDITITFDGYVPTQKIEDLDLSILLSNILDNAIEACQKVEGQKKIIIDSVLAKKMWILTVRNPVKSDVAIHNNRVCTSKENKEMHGYGILNIQRVVERYHGSLQLKCENGEFITKASLLLKSNREEEN